MIAIYLKGKDTKRTAAGPSIVSKPKELVASDFRLLKQFSTK